MTDLTQIDVAQCRPSPPRPTIPPAPPAPVLGIGLKCKIKMSPTGPVVETITIPSSTLGSKAKQLVEKALPLRNSDPDAFLVILPTPTFEGCILDPEKPIINEDPTFEHLDSMETFFSIFSFPVVPEVTWLDRNFQRRVLLDQIMEIGVQRDLFWDLFERGKKKEELVIRLVKPGCSDQIFLSGNFNLLQYRMGEKDSLLVSSISWYKKEFDTVPFEGEYRGNLSYHSGKESGKKKYCYAIKHQTILYLTRSEMDKRIVKVIVLDYCDYKDEKLEDGTDAMILERPLEEGKKLTLVLQPDDKTKLGPWRDLLRAQTKNTAGKVVFGVPLATLMSRPSSKNNSVPQILTSTLTFLDNPEFLSEVGIFRKTGDLGQIERFILKYDLGEEVNFSDTTEEFVECHTVTGLIKKWLGRLPEPLLTPYQNFLNCFVSGDEKEMERLILLELENLPWQNITVLETLCTFLYGVSLKEEENKMGIHNLALVIGPNMLRTSEQGDSSSQLSDSGKVTAIVAALIRIHEELPPLRLRMIQLSKSVKDIKSERRKLVQKSVSEQKLRLRTTLDELRASETRRRPSSGVLQVTAANKLKSVPSKKPRHLVETSDEGSTEETAKPTRKKLTRVSTLTRHNSPQESSSPPASAASSINIVALQDALNEEKEMRKKLEETVQSLVSRVTELEMKVKSLQNKNDTAAMNDVMSMLKF
eukprot:TRINITY_DN7698_c0_g2_i5.p1 TRINITY_DN7698_c0_g2~~TRINITY_DN7698_c0_g2_i5.p1  ORF type:complete len:724 (+),score=168.14 TRINITY_DN7698_c0_g2_i5:70-2172(+)